MKCVESSKVRVLLENVDLVGMALQTTLDPHDFLGVELIGHVGGLTCGIAGYCVQENYCDEQCVQFSCHDISSFLRSRL